MLLPEDSPWGKLTGKISCTPEYALEVWNFIMDPEATGVIFRQYSILRPGNFREKRTFISNYFPPSNPQTERQQANREKMRDAVQHWHMLHSFEKKEWNLKAQKMAMSGYNLHNREYLRGHIVP